MVFDQPDALYINERDDLFTTASSVQVKTIVDYIN